MIRALNLTDVPRMAAIHRQSFLQGWSQADLQTHIQKDINFGLGRPLQGFIIVRTAVDQAEILTLAIDPPARRTGIARALLDITETELTDNGIDVLFLEVAEDNTAAIALYRQMGFENFARRPAYYRRTTGRVAALNFRKNLAANP